VNARGIWQAAYTAGVVLPKPLATAQYWHRSLNPKKLIGVGFSRLAVRSRLIRTPSLAWRLRTRRTLCTQEQISPDSIMRSLPWHAVYGTV
jgi:hypothetical protein